MVLKGVRLPLVGIVQPCQGPISMQFLKSSKFHSSVERAKKSATQTSENESKSLVLATPSGLPIVAPSSSHQLKTETPNP
nr:hypothetical protein CFP56_01848 [Quercus suber]